MGPISRAAIIKRQEADTRFQAALLEELRGIRHALANLSGREALDVETIGERITRVETRITDLERA